jgi:acyl carrier protein
VDRDAVIKKIGEFLGEVISDPDIDRDLNIFESGLVNSLFAMQLLLFVEREFGLQVTNDDLDLKNFHSLNALADFVERKQGTGA